MRRFSVVGSIACPVLLSIATCVAVGDSTNQGNTAFELVIVGDAPDLRELANLVPEDDSEQVRSAAAKAIAKTKVHGGDWEVSYSKNGKYRLDKTPLPASIKDEIPFVEGVLLDNEGREIRRWPRMYKSVFVSSTGRNLVAAEMTWGTGFDFYDLDHAEPIKRFKQHIGDGQFSDDGRYFVALSAGVALYTSGGELLWRKSTEGGGMVFISPGGERVVLAYGRPARGDEPPPPRPEHREFEDPAAKMPDHRNQDKAWQEGADQEPGSFRLPQRQPVRIPQRAGNPVTVFANNGDVLSEYDSDLYRIDEVTFTDDGRLFAVVGTNEFLVFESDSGTFLKRVAVGPPWDDIANVAFSPDGRYLVAAVTRHPTTTCPTRTRAHRYELWDMDGELETQIEVDELGTVAFTDDGEYIVCEKPPRSVFEGGRRVALAPAGLELLRVRMVH